jgi:acyl-CoA oxidase
MQQTIAKHPGLTENILKKFDMNYEEK